MNVLLPLFYNVHFGKCTSLHLSDRITEEVYFYKIY